MNKNVIETLDNYDSGEHNCGRQRYDFIDISKGIGIILVVLCHTLSQESFVNAVIYSFHVPLFFVVSGLFARPQQRFRSYFLKNVKRLLLPFLVFFLLGLTVTCILIGLKNKNIYDIIWCFINANTFRINVSPIWFLACLFNVTILFYVFYKIILSRDNILLTIISIGIIVVIAWQLPELENRFNIYLPFKIDVAFMALIFYSIGFLLKDIILNKKFSSKIIDRIIIIFLTLTVVIISTYFFQGLTNLSGGIYGANIYLYLFSAFCGSILVIVISLFLQRSKVLAFIGRNSLIIFSLHTLIIRSLEFFRKTMGLENNLIISFLITIIVLAIMIVICIVINRVKSVIKRKMVIKE